MRAGTALGEAGEARWDTIQLHRGDMLLMVATSRHHRLPALPDSKDGLQGALFNLWTPDRAHKHHKPNTTHLDPTPPKEALDVPRDLSSWDFPSVDQVLWVGKGTVGRVGLWEGDAAQALFADPPEWVVAGSPTCCFHPNFLSVVRISVNFVQFLRFVVALLHVCPPLLNLCLAHFPPSVGAVLRLVAGHSAPRPAQVPAPSPIARGARRPTRRRRWWTGPERGRQCA